MKRTKNFLKNPVATDMQRNFKTLCLAIILFVAFAVRLTTLIITSKSDLLQRYITGGDAIGYIQLANNLRDFNQFRFDVGNQTAYRMPGYPVFLAITLLDERIIATQFLQIVADLLTISIVFLIGRSVSRNDWIPLLAAIIVSLHPLMIICSVSIYPESLSVFFLTLSIFLLLVSQRKWLPGLLSSIPLCIGIYLKPNFMFIAITLFLFLVVLDLRRTGLKRITLTLIRYLVPLGVIFLLLSPWIIRNYFIFKAFIPLTTSNGSNFYGGNNPLADGGYVSSEPYILPDTAEILSDRLYTDRAINWIISDPLKFLNLLPKKAGRFLSPLALGTSGNIQLPVTIYWVVITLSYLFYLMVLLGAMEISRKKQIWELGILSTPFIILMALSLLTFGASRFMLPALPTFAILSSIGLAKTIIYVKHNFYWNFP